MLLGDMVVFAVFFGSYLVQLGKHPQMFATSQQELSQSYGVLNTLVLLASSLLVALGVRAVRAGAAAVAPWLFAGAISCGLTFAAIKFLEYRDKFTSGIGPNTNDFFMYYFVLTGVHFFHVVLGLGVLTVIAVKSRGRQISSGRFTFIEGGSCFWHVVDLLWIVLFSLLYLVK
ncbi:cytochrome c oxidase subunit 3 [Streptomyces canus]|uniref:cytochrome c oxidase subunit 3 n=2 Tax=Streptomyces TaxID=1883 RepID=UPI002256D1EE|nr:MULTISPECIES: cytochrome c oxidase subunit 3 [Streptomyces]MCX5262044.1 cytochrome c oxidase subunit 3 [Streptomyces canus]